MTLNTVKEYRKEFGLTQKELSRIADIPLQTIKYYESGVINLNKMSLINAVKISYVFGLLPYVFMGLEEYNEVINEINKRKEDN